MVSQNIEAIPFATCSFLSLTLSSVVLIIFLSYRQLRTFEFKLVALLIFSDWIWDFEQSLSVFNYLIFSRSTDFNIVNHQFLCQSQSFVWVFALNLAVAYTSVIAYTIKQSIVNQIDMEPQKLKLYLYPVALAGVIAIFPFTIQGYGQSQPFARFNCHTSENHKLAARITLFVSVNAPMTFGFFFNCYAMYQVIKFLKTQKIDSDQWSRLLNLFIFPLIVLIFWIIPSYVYSFSKTYSSTEQSVLQISMLSLRNLVGFFDSICYGYTSLFSRFYWENCCLKFKYERSSGSQFGNELFMAYTMERGPSSTLESSSASFQQERSISASSLEQTIV